LIKFNLVEINFLSLYIYAKINDMCLVFSFV
jgi:hypothetical protein